MRIIISINLLNIVLDYLFVFVFSMTIEGVAYASLIAESSIYVYVAYFLIKNNEFLNRTVFIEEALHRLVEINYKLGLIEESKKYAKILGYNYLSSEWYKKSYKIFNQNYEVSKKIDKKENKKLIDRIRSFF